MVGLRPAGSFSISNRRRHHVPHLAMCISCPRSQPAIAAAAQVLGQVGTMNFMPCAWWQGGSADCCGCHGRLLQLICRSSSSGQLGLSAWCMRDNSTRIIGPSTAKARMLYLAGLWCSVP